MDLTYSGLLVEEIDAQAVDGDDVVLKSRPGFRKPRALEEGSTEIRPRLDGFCKQVKRCI